MSAQVKMGDGLSPDRVGRITGSRISAILGENPYSKRSDVLREMVREHYNAPSEFTGNDATRYGQDMEPQVLADYERKHGVMSYDGGVCVIHPVHDFLAVTPDGLVGEEGMIECKAPYRGLYTHWSEAPYYVPQMRLQMECCVRAWCDFVVRHRDGSLHVSRIEHDPEWLPSVIPQLEAFMADYRAAIESPDAFLADAVRCDEGWLAAASFYLVAKSEVEIANSRLESAKADLLALAGDMPAKGCGVQVIRSERAGSISYAKAIKELCPDADLTPYTSKPSVIFTVKELAQ